MTKCGFIGLGNQGAPMARRMLDAGYDLVLWARRPETLEPFAETSARFADSIQALAEQVEYCAVCVVDDAGVQAVCESLLSNMAPGGCIVIHSTIQPRLCKDLASRAQAQGIALIDAPVSGGGPAALEGTLTVIVGGHPDQVDRVRPILETFAGTIVHLGDVGAGQSAKLVNNTLMAANLAAAHQALATAASLGIERREFARLVTVSSGRSFSFEVRNRMDNPTDFRHGAQLLAKDVRLLGETAGNAPEFIALRDTAMAFLELALID